MSSSMQQQEELQEDILEDFLEEDEQEELEDEQEGIPEEIKEEDLQEEEQNLQHNEEEQQNQAEQQQNSKIVTYYDNSHEDVDRKVEQHFARALSHEFKATSPPDHSPALHLPYNKPHCHNMEPTVSSMSGPFTLISNPLLNQAHSSSGAMVGPSFPTSPFSPSFQAWNEGSSKDGRVEFNMGGATFPMGVPPISVNPNIDPFGDIPRLPGESKGTGNKDPLPPPIYVLDDSGMTGTWNKTNFTQPTHADAAGYAATAFSPVSPHLPAAARYSLTHLTPSPSASPALPKSSPPMPPGSSRFQMPYSQQAAMHQPTASLGPKYCDPTSSFEMPPPSNQFTPYHFNEEIPYQSSTLYARLPDQISPICPTSSMSASFSMQSPYQQQSPAFQYQLQNPLAMGGGYQNTDQPAYHQPPLPTHHQLNFNYGMPSQLSHYQPSQSVPMVEGAPNNAALPSTPYMMSQNQWDQGDASYHHIY